MVPKLLRSAFAYAKISLMRTQGTITKRGNSYRVRFSLPEGIDGKRRRITNTFKTKKDAERHLAELVIQHDGDRDAGSFFTVEQIIGTWYAETDHAPSTRYDYERAEKLIPESFKAKEIGELRGADFTKLYAELRRDGRSEWRVLRVHELLRGSLDIAWRYEWIPSNPAKRVTPPKPKRKKPVVPSREKVELVVSALTEGKYADPELLLWIRLASTTGARRGEVAGLRWLDVEDGTLWIRRAISYAPGSGLTIGTTKTGVERRVALSPAMIAELDQARTAQQERARRLGVEWTEGSYVIGSDPSGVLPWRPDRVTNAIKTLTKRLDVDGIRLKELRHFVATQLLAAGIDVRTVAGRLGHAQTSMTTDVYADWLPEADREAAQILC